MNFSLIFENNVKWTSPDIFGKDPGWASEENGSLCGIKELRVPLSKDKEIALIGFQKYNFFVEACQNLGGRKTKITSFNFCGAINNKVIIYSIYPSSRKITKKFVKEGEEYAGTATSGWRQGVFGCKPMEGICSI